MSTGTQTCVHLDRACPSWEACANRTAKHSAERARDLIDYAQELARVREEVAAIEKLASDARATTDIADGEIALMRILVHARRALSNMPMHIVLPPIDAGATT
jgi:hypothetical protein